MRWPGQAQVCRLVKKDDDALQSRCRCRRVPALMSSEEFAVSTITRKLTMTDAQAGSPKAAWKLVGGQPSLLSDCVLHKVTASEQPEGASISRHKLNLFSTHSRRD